VLVESGGALVAELPVADGQCLVDEEDLGSQGGGHREMEACPHSRRVGLHAQVEEVAESSEFGHPAGSVPGFCGVETLGQQSELDIPPAGQVGPKHGLHAKERRGGPDQHLASGQGQEAGGGLQQAGFPGAVGADHPDRFADCHVEGHPADRFDDSGVGPLAA
ncbi:uncharacterized protein METZ01_LOCUS190006, partial [marine metagenome]